MTDTTPYPRHDITGVVLAGGRGKRMGGVDKGLVDLHGRPMVMHVIDTLHPQVGRIIINANRNVDKYEALGYEVISDIVGDYFGPLAGMASAMQAASTAYVLTVPCDSPMIEDDLAKRLYHALEHEKADASVAHDGERMHPVFALLKRDLLPSLQSYLESGERKIDRWLNQHRLAVAYFRDKPEAFLNVNSPDDHKVLESKLGAKR
ncbi:MAG: molybdenum cofactor guanylyltransferase [Proteobacteria bacterium]|nr:molybdenum cofactor guanylyltransferase [Pseudomonadota bacterium]TDJ63481.1 MAG: molybdenum cofactor guanylyltransferase [Pseudomonadota bacterium]TDJ70983.1 MAG: molybdenum cofactor guanylyltransferase [Pseudomonadota bacterium]